MWLVVLLLAFAVRIPVQAQTVVVSVVPERGATGVANNAQVVFTFSGFMDVNDTYLTFFDSFFTIVPFAMQWNNTFTVLTCTPSPSWPTGQIQWFLNGLDLFQDPVEDFGTFTVATGGGGSEVGGGTNLITTFLAGSSYLYEQTNASGAVLQDGAPCLFFASADLATNRTAHTVTVTTPMPVGSVNPLTFRGEGAFTFTGFASTQSAFEFAYPPGNYQFDVNSVRSNQQVLVNLSLAQPNAPTLANFASVTGVDPAKDFLLSWNAFQSGTTADFIQVEIDDGTLFSTPDYGKPGALTGTAMSVVIPANRLSPGATYDGWIHFYRYASTTNSAAKYVSTAFRSSGTRFTLTTAGTQVVTPVNLQNPGLVNGKFGFELTAPAGLTLTVQYSDRPWGTWNNLLTTNAPGGNMRVTDPAAPGSGARYYRVLR